MAAAGMVFVTGCGSSAGTSASTTAVQTESSTEAESAESENTEANSEEADENTETADNEDALVLADQGMFSAGGITVTSEGTFDPENHWEETGAGQTAHVDHANVFYQIPENETGLPMVFLHGYGQSRMGWMTTPDGRKMENPLLMRALSSRMTMYP